MLQQSNQSLQQNLLATPPPAQQKLAITISALPEETTTVIIEARVEGLGGAETASSGTLGLG